MTQSRIELVVAVLVLVTPNGGAGQELREGERIRVTAPEVLMEPQAGRLVSLNATSLVLASGQPGQWVVPFDLMTGLEVSLGERGNFWKGALIGGGAGFGGTLLALSGASCEADTGGNLCVMVATFVGLGGALLGGGVGALVKTERWAPVSDWR